MNRVYIDKKRRRFTGQQPGKKSASRPSDKPRINRGSTADFVPAFGLHRVSLVRASGEAFKRCVFDALGERGTLVSWAINSVGTQSYPTALRRPLGAPTRTARSISGF